MIPFTLPQPATLIAEAAFDRRSGSCNSIAAPNVASPLSLLPVLFFLVFGFAIVFGAIALPLARLIRRGLRAARLEARVWLATEGPGLRRRIARR